MNPRTNPNRIARVVGDQCRRPTGWLGRVLGHVMSWEHRPLTDWTVRLMGVKSDHRVLDVECGGAMAIRILATTAVNGFVAGIDHSQEMVRQARRRNAALVRAGKVAITQGRIESLPYGHESFDRVVGIEVFCFWPDPITSLREIYRVTRPGGSVALAVEDSRQSPRRQGQDLRTNDIGALLYSGEEMQDLLVSVGFSRAWFESMPARGRGWLCAQGVK